MTEKRFRKGYVLGDTGLIDELGEPKWFIENINSVSDLRKNWDKVIDKLNELAEETQFLNKQLNIYRDASKVDARENKELLEDIDELYEENRHLRKLADIGQTEPNAIINMLNLQQTTIKELKEENKQLKKQREELFIRERDTKNELRELKDEHLAWKRVDL